MPSNKTNNLFEKQNDVNTINTLNNHVQLSDVYFQTLIVRLHNGTKEMLVRAILDTGSMKSYICSDLAQNINYKPTSELNLKQSLFGDIRTVERV